jgi:hypothetical protein
MQCAIWEKALNQDQDLLCPVEEDGKVLLNEIVSRK